MYSEEHQRIITEFEKEWLAKTEIAYQIKSM